MTTTMTREIPLLLTTDLVRATLDGRKTQTRRVIKCPDTTTAIEWVENYETMPSGHYTGWAIKCDAPLLLPCKCPYAVGDTLWVREKFLPCRTGSTLGQCPIRDATYVCFWDGGQCFRSGGKPYEWNLPNPPNWDRQTFRPSIHMPRWAARLFLRVTDVCRERVQEMTVSDAIDEGGMTLDDDAWMRKHFPTYMNELDECMAARAQQSDDRWIKPPIGPNPLERFKALWDSINAKRGYSWESNPWVWVVSFERLEKP